MTHIPNLYKRIEVGKNRRQAEIKKIGTSNFRGSISLTGDAQDARRGKHA